MFCTFLVLVWGVLAAVCGTGSSNTQHGLERIRKQSPVDTYAEEDMCELPEPLLNGRFSPSPNRCPTHVSNLACQMVPGTIVQPNFPIFIACNPGYKLNQTNTVSLCLKGLWKPSLPGCVRVWGVLSAVCGTGSSNTQHGLERIRRQTPVDTYAEEDMCELPEPLLNGRFSPSPNRCPTHVSNLACQMVPGTIVQPNFPIFIACNPGYKLNQTNTVSVCLKGLWKPSLPGCVRDAESCTLPDKPAHGKYTSTECTSTRDRRPECRNVPGTIVPSTWKLKYSCDPNYDVDRRPEYSVCTKGVWSNPPKCVHIKAPEGFNCPVNTSSLTRYAHRDDCRKYYICLEANNREYQCPLGTVFHIGDPDGTGNCEDAKDVPGCEDYYGP